MPRQDSLNDQLMSGKRAVRTESSIRGGPPSRFDIIQIANDLKCYDAADYIKSVPVDDWWSLDESFE